MHFSEPTYCSYSLLGKQINSGYVKRPIITIPTHLHPHKSISEEGGCDERVPSAFASLSRKPPASLLRKKFIFLDTPESLTMKATLLLGTILLMSLVMANDQSKSSPEDKGKSSPEDKPAESESKVITTTPESAAIMMSKGPVFFLLPLMWMVVYLLHI